MTELGIKFPLAIVYLQVWVTSLVSLLFFSLLNHQVGCLQRIQNRKVRVVFSLKKFDHVSVSHEQLGLPNISEEIEIHSLAAFHCHCFSHQCLQLQPPITFGRSHTYNTWCKAYFANSTYHHLVRTQTYF